MGAEVYIKVSMNPSTKLTSRELALRVCSLKSYLRSDIRVLPTPSLRTKFSPPHLKKCVVSESDDACVDCDPDLT